MAGQRGDQSGSQDQNGFGGPGGQRGFGRLGLQGGVVAVEDDGLTLTLADGETQTVLIGPGTSFVRQADADPSQLAVGDEVLIQDGVAASQA